MGPTEDFLRFRRKKIGGMEIERERRTKAERQKEREKRR